MTYIYKVKATEQALEGKEFETIGGYEGYTYIKSSQAIESLEVATLPPEFSEALKEQEKQRKEQAWNELKMQRSKELKESRVTYNEIELDADERSQDRISRAVLALSNENEKTFWVDANNQPREFTKTQMLEILRLAGINMTAIWQRYAKLREEL